MISNTNNGKAVRLYVGTVSQTVRSGNGPYKEKYHARMEPFSRFSPSYNLISQ
ncbi:MAG: hypothetical protein WBE11_00645 [Candidatus Aminicenantaceae bacterium]